MKGRFALSHYVGIAPVDNECSDDSSATSTNLKKTGKSGLLFPSSPVHENKWSYSFIYPLPAKMLATLRDC